MDGMDDRMIPAHHTWMDDVAGLSLDTGPGIKPSWFPTLEPVRRAHRHTAARLHINIITGAGSKQAAALAVVVVTVQSEFKVDKESLYGIFITSS